MQVFPSMKKELKLGKYPKTVGCYKNGVLVKTYFSTGETVKDGFKQPAVARCARGERKTYKGYTWKYIEE